MKPNYYEMCKIAATRAKARSSREVEGLVKIDTSGSDGAWFLGINNDNDYAVKIWVCNGKKNVDVMVLPSHCYWMTKYPYAFKPVVKIARHP